jgi:hypothetical protein
MRKIVPLQAELRPALPNVYGAKDYCDFREILTQIEVILTQSKMEDDLISKALLKHVTEHSIDQASYLKSKKSDRLYKNLQFALRCNIARHLTGESYRKFSIRLSDSTLLQWFTMINGFSNRKAISKSTMERFEKMFEEQDIMVSITSMISNFSNIDIAKSCGLEKPIETDVVYADCTCIKANIHFPVDWILLRDAVKSLLSAIMTIRRQGLKNRMAEPSEILREMNNLCIKMTHARRKIDSKKSRKTIFRQMKKLTRRIELHARRYRELLLNNSDKTCWSEKKIHQVISRIDNILTKLPAAIKQAHERIIGQRIVKSKDKILSFYDQDAHVIVRGKSGSEVEFGQSMLLVEQGDGLIIDWELFLDKTPSDCHLVKPIINRLESNYGAVKSIVGDRAFSSKDNEKHLEEKKIDNGLCPKSPFKLKESLKDKNFARLQKRRSQTESRIGIFKNVFLGNPLRSRMSINKKIAINWCVLTHNLWVLARKSILHKSSLSQQAA